MRPPIEGTPKRDPEVRRARNRVNAERAQPSLIDANKAETKFGNLPRQLEGDFLAGYEWQAADAEMRAAQAAPQMFSTDRPVSPVAPESARGGAPQFASQQDTARLAAAKARLDKANANVATWAARVARPVQSYPSLAKAMLEVPDLTEADVRRVVSFAAAWTAADAIRATDATGQMNILLSLPPEQRSVVLDIISEQEKASRDAKSAEQDKALADEADRTTWGPARLATQGVGEAVGVGALNLLEDVYGGIAQYARGVQAGQAANARAGMVGIPGAAKALIDPFFNWDDVADNTMNEQVLADARREYGSVPVDLILELRTLKAEGDPAPIATISAKYFNDPERAPIIRSLVERVWDDPVRQAEADRILGLADKLLSAETGDLGAMVTTTNPVTGQPIPIDAWWRGSTPQTALSKATNVAATFLLDPFIIGSKGRAIFLGAKYGLERLAIDAGGEVTAAALRKPAVNAYLQDLTRDLGRYADLKAAGKDASQLGATIGKRYAKYFPEDVLFDMTKAGVRTPELFIKYVDDTNNMLKIERGLAVESALDPEAAARSIAAIEQRSVFGRMAEQQFAKRGKPLLPRNSVLWGSHVRRTLGDAVNTLRPDTDAKKAVRAFYDDANNPNVPAGAILFGDPAGVAKFDSTVTTAWDKTTRWLATTAGSNTIYTADARDTKTFYKFARLFMSKPHAQYLAEQWRDGTQSQRILMWVGVVRSAAAKRGASEIEDRVIHLGSKMRNNKNELTVKELTDSLTFAQNPKNQFAPTSINITLEDGRAVGLDEWLTAQVDEFAKGSSSAIPPAQPSWPGGPTLFHGTSQRFDDDVLNEVYNLPQSQNMAGAGLYSTDGWKTASVGYVKKGKGENPAVYRIVWKGDSSPNILDADAPAPDYVRNWVKKQHEASYWIENDTSLQLVDDPSATTLDLIRAIRSDMAYGGSMSRSEAEEIIGDLNYVMQDQGVDALRHAGGKARKDAIEDHSVYIWLDTSKVGVEDVTPKVPTASEIDAYRSSVIANSPASKTVLDAAVQSNPANFDGNQLAIHLWQTSDYLAVPNLSDIALITKRAQLTNQILGLTPNSFGSEFVNWWSLLNLAGFRYSTRNALEDWTMYALTGGYLMDAVKGRAISTGVREARGQNIGWFARKMRRASGEAPAAGEPYSVTQNVVLPQLNKAEVAEAHAMAAEGDLSGLRDLVVKAVIRQKIGRSLSDDEARWVSEYVASDAGFTQLDEITELAHHLNLGTFPGQTADNFGGVAAADGQVVYPRKDYVDIEMAGNNPLKFTYWHRGIEGVVRRDGIMGRVAMTNLDDTDAAIAAVKNAIEKDKKYGYRERLAAFYEANVSTDEFARRYVQDVRNLFTTKNGDFNEALWRRFIDDTDEGRAVRWADNVDGEQIPRVSVDYLMKLDKSERPAYVLGQEMMDKPIVIPASISEKMWNMMGNAMARISREPIYFGNYLRARKGLSAYEAKLAEAVGPKAAGLAANKIAQDRALTLTLQFTDNPANQSMLAWRMRNFARYYRATEDFYRRVYRMAKYEPIGIYKAWLTLNVLDETGFVHTDSYGDKYFMYPGDGVVNNAMGQVLSWFNGPDAGMYTGSTPLTFGGKIKMLAPSFDPNAAMPMLGSPLAAFSVKTVLALVPQFEQYEKYILGVYSADQPLVQSMMPAPVMRVLGALSQDERDSAYSSAVISATKVMMAAGKMPGLEATEAEKAAAARGIAALATQTLQLRVAAGFLYTASPQTLENDVTAFAREFGADGMSAVYRQLLNEETEAGAPDPFSSALIKGVSIYGLGFTAYSVPESGPGEDFKSLPEYSYSKDVMDYVNSNDDLIRKYPTASMFLAPARDGSYNADTRKWLIDNGYKTTPRVSEYIDRLNMAEGAYVYSLTMDDADAYIASQTTEDGRKKAEEAKKAAKVRVYAKYPGLDTFFQSSIAQRIGNADTFLNGEKDENGLPKPGGSEIRRMVDDFYAGKLGPIPEPVKYIAEAIATYDYYTASSKQITGRTKAENEARSSNRMSLLANLQAIGRDNEQARIFIKRVMYPLLDANAEGLPRG